MKQLTGAVSADYILSTTHVVYRRNCSIISCTLYTALHLTLQWASAKGSRFFEQPLNFIVSSDLFFCKRNKFQKYIGLFENLIHLFLKLDLIGSTCNIKCRFITSITSMKKKKNVYVRSSSTWNSEKLINNIWNRLTPFTFQICAS